NQGSLVVSIRDDSGRLVNPNTGQPLAPRPIRLLVAGGEKFPLPPADDPIDSAAPEYDLCRGDSTALSNTFGRIVDRAPQPGDGARPGDIERFGRYLFHPLLGPTAWKAMAEAAAGVPFEMALAWNLTTPADPDDRRWFTRLPWEMMYCPDPALPGGG